MSADNGAGSPATERNLVRPPGVGDVEFINAKALNEEGTTGVILEGTLESRVKNQFGKEDFKFTRESDGQTVILNTAGNLGRELAEVAPGTFCQISYNGMQTMSSGQYKGKPVHNFTVMIAG